MELITFLIIVVASVQIAVLIAFIWCMISISRSQRDAADALRVLALHFDPDAAPTGDIEDSANYY